jgi:iron complex outermembrane recepter protein
VGEIVMARKTADALPRVALTGCAVLAGSICGGTAAQAQIDEGTKLEEIVITADRRDSFGADYVQAGTFRNARQIDTPLTVAVIPETLLKAQQANGILDALRNTAGVTSSQINTSVYSNLAIRGIVVENRGNYRLNGTLPIINLIDMPLENKYRVEALKGASALYYGFTTPAGIINLTSKRPTAEPYAGVKFAGNDHGQFVTSFDLSGTSGQFGARVNGAIGTQEIGVKKTDGDRKFLSGAFDWKPSDAFLVQIDAEYIAKQISEPTIIQLNTTGPFAFILPPLQDPSTNLGADWMRSDSTETNALLHAQWKFLPAWQVSVDLGQSKLDRYRRFSTFLNYNLITGAGTVSVDPLNRVAYQNRMARLELAGTFVTGPLLHEVLAGYTRNIREIGTPNRTAQTFVQNYFNPVDLPFAPFPTRVVANPSKIDDAGVYVFDRVRYERWLELLAGVRRSDYRETSVLGPNYKTTPTSFSFGLIVKPLDWVSVYGTYIEGLESGGTAPAGSANFGATLPANVSVQYEGGIKIEPRKGFLLTAAYFDIDRASAFVDPATRFYVQDGRARYRGFEFSATGEISADISLYGSALFLDAKQGTAANPALIGKRLDNTPRVTYSLFAEYRLPMVPGLAVSAGLFHTGDRAVNALNQAFAPSFTTFDLGASYATHMYGCNTVFRVNAENVAGTRYWAATGSGYLAQGLPAQIKMSVEMTF